MHTISNLEYLYRQILDIDTVKIYGKILSIKGTLIECTGISDFVSIGSRCIITCTGDRKHDVMCEVVGFDHNVTLLMPFKDIDGISSGSKVCVSQNNNVIFPDESWLGRVLDPFCIPKDDHGILKFGNIAYQLKATPPLSHKRGRLGNKIDLGVKVIDTFTPCCYGQRIGIFSGSGVGKSVLISMLTKYADTDVKVIGLVGERSREVKEFIEDYLGPEGLRRAVIIVATGDESALMRRRAAYTTMAVAEYFRDQGKEVLCIIDSITRFAMAQREIGLAVGESPTTKGYTPSVFSELPRLLERAGPGINGVNITGLFTILVEGDDHNEPVSDAVRGIVDGHIIMDRSIAERGRFPAVDVLRSVSRALPQCNSDLENKQITVARKYLSIYHDMAEMIRLGAYKNGTDHEVDMAISYYSKLEGFLAQKPNEVSRITDSYKMLGEILGITG